MEKTRDFRSLARLATVAGMIAFGALLLGVTPGQAAPVAPVGPTDIVVPTAPPLPPKPEPCAKKCVPPTLEPCFVLPGNTCTPPTLQPCVLKPEDCKPPTSEPPTSEPTKPTRPTRPKTPTNPPTTDPTGIPTPNRIDTGDGSSLTESPNWTFLAVTGGAFLAMVAAGGIWWLRRTDQDRR